MNNEEIKALLRDLAEKAEADGEVKSKTVRITFGGDDPDPVRPARPAREEADEAQPEEKDPGEAKSSGGLLQGLTARLKGGGKKKKPVSAGRGREKKEPDLEAEEEETSGRAEPDEETVSRVSLPRSRKAANEAEGDPESSSDLAFDDESANTGKTPVRRHTQRPALDESVNTEETASRESDATDRPENRTEEGEDSASADASREKSQKASGSTKASGKQAKKKVGKPAWLSLPLFGGKKKKPAKKTSVDDDLADLPEETPEDQEILSDGAEAGEDTVSFTAPEKSAAEGKTEKPMPDAEDDDDYFFDDEDEGDDVPERVIPTDLSKPVKPALEAAKQTSDEAGSGGEQPLSKTEAGSAASETKDTVQGGGEETDEDLQPSEGSAADGGDEADHEDLPGFEEVLAHCGKRPTPVEPARFESDAAAFRSEEPEPYGEEEEDTRTRKEKVRDFFENLRGKGIGRRELIMILSGIILLILIVTVLLSVLGNQRKKENVTSEDGLIVTVEKEPENWCRSAEVTLGISTAAPLQSISVNGEPQEFSGGNRTKLKVTANTETLDVMVVSEEKVMNAQVDVPKIDVGDPVINISSSGGVVTLDVTDSRSGVKEVWCGVIEGLSDVPEYHRYTGPFQAEKDTMYCCFAIDNAGNATEPLKTNLTPAVGIQMSATSVSLFPGETYQLDVKASPDGGFLNNLEISNSDESVASMDETGLITALKDGETVISASAAGLPSVSCVVRVQSEAEVTISALGDILLGEDENYTTESSFSAILEANGEEYFFENVRSILEADDFTVANYEGTLTNSTNRMWEDVSYKGEPANVEILVDGGVDGVFLANDHSSDYGNDGFADTQNCLRQVGVASIDDGDILIRELNGIKVAIIGINAMNEGAEGTSRAEDTKNWIESARSQGAKIVIVSYHWGNENEYVPTAAQESLAYGAIDAGADLVIGHHPKVLQRIEEYNGKYIAFSLGAFCYGGTTMPADMDTVIFQETFKVSPEGEITGTKIDLTPCSMSSDPSWNNCQPTPVSGEAAQRILNRLNGESTVTEETDAEGNVVEVTGTLSPGIYTQSDSGEMTPGLYTQDAAN